MTYTVQLARIPQRTWNKTEMCQLCKQAGTSLHLIQLLTVFTESDSLNRKRPAFRRQGKILGATSSLTSDNYRSDQSLSQLHKPLLHFQQNYGTIVIVRAMFSHSITRVLLDKYVSPSLKTRYERTEARDDSQTCFPSLSLWFCVGLPCK